MSSNDGNAGVVFMAFLLGAITGAAVALLWAPAPGTETRRVLGDRAREGAEKMSEAARQGREFIDRQRDNLSDAIDKGREAYQKARGERKENT